MKKTLSIALLAMMLLTSLTVSAWTSFTVYQDKKTADGNLLRYPYMCNILDNETGFLNSPFPISYEYDDETGEDIPIYDYNQGWLNYGSSVVCWYKEDTDIIFHPALEKVTGIECSYNGTKLSVSWNPVEGANLYRVDVYDRPNILLLPYRSYIYFLRDPSFETNLELFGDVYVQVQPTYLSDDMRTNLELLGNDDNVISYYCENLGQPSDLVQFSPEPVKPNEATMLNNLGTYWYQYNTLYGGNLRNMNGEPWINLFFGETIGSDYFDGKFNISGFHDTIYKQSFFTEGREYWMNQMGWIYPRELILVATQALEMLEEKGWDLPQLEAQARAMRATQYLRLLQIFAPRWEDSSNGTVAVLPEFLPKDYLMDNFGNFKILYYTYPNNPGVLDNLKIMNEVKDMIYADLDKAIELMEAAGPIEEAVTEYNTVRNFMPIDAMKGIYARTAMLFHDYETARKYASEARKDHPIMTADEYLSGFAKANNEWIWKLDGEGLKYWQQMAFNGCNGPYPCTWGDIGAGAINYDLYRQMDCNDIRRNLYFTPDKVGYLSYPEDFFDPKYIVESDLNINHNSNLSWELSSFCKENKPNPDWPDAYASPSGDATGIYAPFGAQIKFWCDDKYGHSEVPMMRGAEMLLIEAEAAWELGDETKARALLDELNIKRITGYTGSNASGTALRDEIRLARRIELWGEGFSWFDLKRWNLPMVRRPWIAYDESSNNIPAEIAVTINPEDNNGWRCVLPESAYYQAPSELKGKAPAATRPAKPVPQSKPALQTTPAKRPEKLTPYAR